MKSSRVLNIKQEKISKQLTSDLLQIIRRNNCESVRDTLIRTYKRFVNQTQNTIKLISMELINLKLSDFKKVIKSNGF